MPTNPDTTHYIEDPDDPEAPSYCGAYRRKGRLDEKVTRHKIRVSCRRCLSCLSRGKPIPPNKAWAPKGKHV